MEKMTQQQIIDSFFPSVSIDRVSIYSDGVTSKIQYLISIEEQFTTNTIANFIGNEKIFKYLKLVLFNQYTDGMDIFKKDPSAILKLEKENSNIKIISLDINSNILNFVLDRKDGKNIYRTSFLKEFDVPSIKQNVTLFYVVRFDLKAMTEEFGFAFDSNNPISHSSIYFFDVLVKGTPVDSRVEDYRKVEKSLDTMNLTKDFINLETNFFSSFNTEVIEKYKNKWKSDFVPSDISLTKNVNELILFDFILDMQQILQKNSAYPKLFEISGSTLKPLIENTKIYYIEILRRRIEVKNSLNKCDTPYLENWNSKNTSESPLSLIITASDNTTNKVKIVHSVFGCIYQADNPNVGFLSDTRFRIFKVQDKEMKNHKNGIYQYGVKLVIEDPIFKFINGFIEIMQKDLTKFEEYYKFANSMPITSIQEGYQNPHIDMGFEKDIKIKKTSGYIDSNTNSFTKIFAEHAREKYGHDSPWIVNVNSFFQTIFSLFGENSFNHNQTYLLDLLSKISDPETGNIEGVEKTLNIMRNFYMNVTNTIFNNDSGSSERSGEYLPMSNNKSSNILKGIIRCEAWFNKDVYVLDHLEENVENIYDIF
ncbi:hypothetical protein M0R19_04365 [Candidatus Pacearchaeota archaeon]|nr:hypothetical protein [Candidatus Pacearchaeota archaeon]